MKGLYALLLVAWGILSGRATYAQPEKLRPIVDSLQNLLNSRPDDDTLKVWRMHELANVYLVSYEYEKALRLAVEAQHLAKKIGYDRGEELYLRRLAVFHTIALWNIHYAVQAHWLRGSGSSEENAEMGRLSYYANLRGIQNSDKILGQLHLAAEEFSKHNEQLLLAHVLYVLSYRYSLRQEHSQELLYATRSAALFRQLGQVDLLLYLDLTKMVSNLKLGRFEKASEIERTIYTRLARIEDRQVLALARYYTGRYYWTLNRFGSALEQLLQCEELLTDTHDSYFLIRLYQVLCRLYDAQGYSAKAIACANRALRLLQSTNVYADEAYLLALRANNLTKLGKLDEAQREIDRVLAIDRKRSNISGIMYMLNEQGQLELKKGNPQKALSYLFEVERFYKEQNMVKSYCQYAMAQCFQQTGDLRKSITFASSCYDWANKSDWMELKLKSGLLLSELYEQAGQSKTALQYLKEHNAWKNAMLEQDNAYRLVDIETRGIQRKSQQEKARLQAETLKKEEENRRQRLWLLMVAGALVSSVGLATLLYRSNRSKQKSNTLLQRQRDEISQQRLQLQNSLEELRSTQTQLIQKEKLASLGELTAGIAHEIQNPLNFVNNYSEVNMELIEELQEEAEKGDTEEIKALLTDLSDNERKIHHHGRRADAIVRGMLEHARATPGEKVPTDLNALADEYLRLAYHGLRAKDSAFQCELITDFDPNLGRVEVAPSELGRVLLNLFSNAFYAVKQRQLVATDQAYTPTVWVNTRRLDGRVEIRVGDNGTGMPGEVQAKIFQPFFTTKPTGEGTGLGLSLSYDIVTKGHGGALRVESVPGEGTEFVVELPA